MLLNLNCIELNLEVMGTNIGI